MHRQLFVELKKVPPKKLRTTYTKGLVKPKTGVQCNPHSVYINASTRSLSLDMSRLHYVCPVVVSSQNLAFTYSIFFTYSTIYV